MGMSGARAVVMVVLMMILVACGQGGGPLVFPKAARWGDSVVMTIDDVIFQNVQKLNASKQNVDIELTDGTTTVVVPARAVIESPVVNTSAAGLTFPGAAATFALFDLPQTWNGGTAPTTLTMTLVFESVVVPEYYVATIEVTGGGGSQIAFAPWSEPANYEHKPLLRLKPIWNAGTAVGFDPAWTIGSIEFRLRYPGQVGQAPGPPITPLVASGASHLTRGLVSSSIGAPLAPENDVHVVAIAPDGFSLGKYDNGCTSGPCDLVSGSLIDFAFDVDETGIPLGTPVFDTGDFWLEDLKVMSLDGVQLNSAGETWDQYFDLYALNNDSNGGS